MKKSTALAALLVLLMTGGVHSAGMPPEAKGAESATTGVIVNKFIYPDGRIDLDALRQSGYEGALDLEGFDVTIDPSTGRPLLRPTVAAETDSDPDDIYWAPLGSGMNGPIYALTVYDGKLIAGGDFTMAGGVEASRVASWDGTDWSPLGSGTNNYVVALAVYDGDLIAGGTFTVAGGVAASHVASWDGTNWSPLATGISGVVNSLTIYNAKLVAAGYIQTPYPNPGWWGNVVAWDGSGWTSLADMYPDSHVDAVAVYDGKLIAAGEFGAFLGGASANNIASWDGSTWSGLGNGLEGGDFTWVWSLTQYGSNLIAGGFFGWAGVAVNNIASWDGGNWSPLSSGMNNIVFALTVYNGKLIAGGDFTTAGGIGANHIASWDGNAWSPLGSGTGGRVGALAEYNNELIVGGNFTIAGDKSAAYVAAWTKYCCQLRGDFNQSDLVDILDVDDFLGWLFREDLDPGCQEEANVNADERVDILDVDYLLNWMFRDGPAPMPCP